MKTCDTCTHYKPRFIPCYGCHNNDGWEPKPATNADIYRSYSDDELAELFSQIETEGKAYGPRGKAQWLEWLRQEAAT